MPLKSFVKEPRSQRRGITSWKVKPELFQWDRRDAAAERESQAAGGGVPPPARTCGEDLPQDHLRHLLGGQPGPAQHLPDGGGAQLVRGERRQPAVEGPWEGSTEGERSAPGLPPGPGGSIRHPARPPLTLTHGGPGGGHEDDGVRAHGGSSGGGSAAERKRRERSGGRGRGESRVGAGPAPRPPRAGRVNGARAGDS